jgi:surface polysaccharide O-acyltransferase-like enzyme
LLLLAKNLTMGEMQSSPLPISLSKSQTLKGVAIIPVVVIHFLAYLPGIYTVSQWHLLFTAIDQLGRYCVPLFLLLSGYGLALRYRNEEPALLAFFKQRVWKLIPLYLLWSVVSYVLLSIVPAWQTSGIAQPLWFQLLTGSADYQLYFVILIFQLYAVFPFCLKLVKKYPNFTLLMAFLVQLVLFVLYRRFELPGQNNLDGLEYLYFASWLGFFVLGIWLALRPFPIKLKPLLLPFTLIGGTIAVWDSWHLIRMVSHFLCHLLFPLATHYYSSI